MKIWIWLALMAIAAVPVRGAYAEGGAFDDGWLKLLHYEKSGSGYESVVENGEFFLTPGGGENPEAEYRAAVTAFNAEAKPAGEEAETSGGGAVASGDEMETLGEDKDSGELKKCAFPARFIYLKRRVRCVEHWTIVPTIRNFWRTCSRKRLPCCLPMPI